MQRGLGCCLVAMWLCMLRPTCPSPSTQSFWGEVSVDTTKQRTEPQAVPFEHRTQLRLRCAGRLSQAVVSANARLADEVDEPELLLGGPIPVLISLGGKAARAVMGGLRGFSLGGKDKSVAVRKRDVNKASNQKKGGRDKVQQQKDQDALDMALLVACVEGRTRQVQELIAEGANVTRRDACNWNRWSPLHFAEVLLSAGAPADLPDWDHYTPLHYAAYLGGRGQAAVARALLRYGANIYSQTWDGKTPHDLASYYDNGDVADVLQSAACYQRSQIPFPLRLLWQPPRVRLDRYQIRADREAFLQQLTKDYPEPVPQADIDKFNEMIREEEKAKSAKRSSKRNDKKMENATSS